MSKEEKKKTLLGLGSKKTTEHAAVQMTAAMKKEETTEVEKVLLSYNLNNELEAAVKSLAQRTGKTMTMIIQQQLEKLFANDEAQLINDFSASPHGKRSVKINADLYAQLDKYTAKNNVSKRFVIEALLSDYVRGE